MAPNASLPAFCGRLRSMLPSLGIRVHIDCALMSFTFLRLGGDACLDATCWLCCSCTLQNVSYMAPYMNACSNDRGWSAASASQSFQLPTLHSCLNPLVHSSRQYVRTSTQPNVQDYIDITSTKQLRTCLCPSILQWAVRNNVLRYHNQLSDLQGLIFTFKHSVSRTGSCG